MSLLSNSQELDFGETLDYINNKLINECPGHSGRVITPFDHAYYKLNVDDKGLLKVKYFLEDDTYVSHSDAYIRNLVVKDKLREIDGSYYISLKCKTSKCFTEVTVLDVKDMKGSTEFKDSTDLRCTKYRIAKKTQKAIKHLIELAQNQEKFYKKDPFSD